MLELFIVYLFLNIILFSFSMVMISKYKIIEEFYTLKDMIANISYIIYWSFLGIYLFISFIAGIFFAEGGTIGPKWYTIQFISYGFLTLSMAGIIYTSIKYLKE